MSFGEFCKRLESRGLMNYISDYFQNPHTQLSKDHLESRKMRQKTSEKTNKSEEIFLND